MSISSDAPRECRDTRGAITFRGSDAAKFLQGQLSADVLKLGHGNRTWTGLHNPQGRVIALLDLARTGEQEWVATLPRELVTPVIARLRRYVLRARLTLDDTGEAPAMDALAAVRSGVPEVYLATSEAFVAQMLNLDLLGAIAFDKGCYTGQEVIARAHYRGRVKRRAQRWLNTSGRELAPGDAARSGARSLSVVRVASLPEGGAAPAGQEILAVGTFLDSGDGSSDGSGHGSGDAPAVSPTVTEIVEVSGPLPLPYSLPE